MLFPGEQNQYVGMCGACRDLPSARQMLQSASSCFGFDVEEMMRSGPQERLDRVENCQLLTYVADCLALEVFRAQSPDFEPYCVAGFSVGLYVALVAAEVLTYDEGLLLVKARAESTRRWCDECDMQALGISGIDASAVKLLCHDAIERDMIEGTDNPEVHISHIWGRPHALICSGLQSTVQKLFMLLQGYDTAHVCVLERACAALHTPMAQALVGDLEKVLRSLPLKPPKCDVYFNSGQAVAAGQHPDMIFEGIMAELTSPLCWDAIVLHCLMRGVSHFIECGPGHSLRNLMQFNTYTDVRRCLKPQEFTSNVEV